MIQLYLWLIIVVIPQYICQSFWKYGAAKAGVTPIITDIPTATDAATFLFIFLFLFIIPASFLNYDGLLITGYFASFVCAFAFFPRNPMDVLQINLSNIINIAGNTRRTTIILIIAPLASNVQIEPIISTCE